MSVSHCKKHEQNAICTINNSDPEHGLILAGIDKGKVEAEIKKTNLCYY